MAREILTLVTRILLFPSSVQNEYQADVPAIMERVVENLKVPNGQHIYVRAFLLLRVVLLHVTEDSLSAWWPIIISEIVCWAGVGRGGFSCPVFFYLNMWHL